MARHIDALGGGSHLARIKPDAIDRDPHFEQRARHADRRIRMERHGDVLIDKRLHAGGQRGAVGADLVGIQVGAFGDVIGIGRDQRAEFLELTALRGA